MSKQLATVQKINSFIPIEGKDFIVLATFENLGWEAIVRKEDFNIGDQVVFIMPGALLPEENEAFKFMESKKYKVKTMKMGGVLSSGLVMSLDILPKKNWKVGDDVTDVLKIKDFTEEEEVEATQDSKKKRRYPKWLMKYAWFRKLVLEKRVKKDFPNVISKTDEERVQNVPWMIEKSSPSVICEKVDGCSSSYVLQRIPSKYFWKKDKFDFAVCSRTRRLSNSSDMPQIWKCVEKYNIEQVLRDMIENDDWIAIQGECIAPNVQGNPYKITEPDLYVFNVIFQKRGRLPSAEGKIFMEHHGLKFVPIIETCKDMTGMTVNDVLEYATGKSAINPEAMREGVVIRSIDGKKSYKAVSPDYLIKRGE